MSIEDYPSIELVRQSLRYEDGRLYWLERPREHFANDRVWKAWNTRLSGVEAGRLTTWGDHRWIVEISYIGILRHTIVWALHNREWKRCLDHINRNTLDDRIENLRIATPSQQAQNRSIYSNNTSGFKGVSWFKPRRKWRAEIRVKGKTTYVGLFDDPAEAHQAYMEAARKYFGEFATDGF